MCGEEYIALLFNYNTDEYSVCRHGRVARQTTERIPLRFPLEQRTVASHRGDESKCLTHRHVCVVGFKWLLCKSWGRPSG